ncbi:MAG: bifunctional diaminohydroxyphosphoribosylaminopyrimidine deaminase/5-amino-6-(5-phosphoribosylamino)uracil reductase RibD [Phycisphaerae bacterium]
MRTIATKAAKKPAATPVAVIKADDAEFLRRALRLAKRGEGRVEPNPMVGCVLVKDGKIIGEGYHRKFGTAHAEVNALKVAGADVRGATAYVTLEPCCITAKTGPCTDALIAAKVARVVVGTLDPNPRINGDGVRALRKARIRVVTGVEDEAAADLIAPFRKLMLEKRPWVIAKWGQSLDGKVATSTGESKWITDDAMRQHANRTRGRLDAIIVGINTVLADDPQLTARLDTPRRIAARVVLDSFLRTPLKCNLVRTAPNIPTWIFCTNAARSDHAAQLERAGCRVTRVGKAVGGVALPDVLKHLGEANFTNVLVEGGSKILGAFFEQRLVDEIHAYVAPKLIGGRNAPGIWHTNGVEKLENAIDFTTAATSKKIGSGWLISGRLKK